MTNTIDIEPGLNEYSSVPVITADLALAGISGIRSANLKKISDVLDYKLATWQDTGQDAPRLITSVGGSQEVPSIVSPGNLIAGVEVLKSLRQSGVPATYCIRFASEYAVDANGFDSAETAKNASVTTTIYKSFVDTFYPELKDAISFEVEPIKTVDSLPGEILDLVGYNTEKPIGSDELMQKVTRLTRYGRNRNPDITYQQSIRYLLSHITIFEDVIYPGADSDFVIKIGAPSEMQFSDFQAMLMEEAVALKGLRAGLANPTKYRPYNQLSLFGPRLGSRPPYYKQAPNELDFLSEPVATEDIGINLPVDLTDEQRQNALLPKAYLLAAEGNEDLAQRYRNFFGLLSGAKISINKYQDWLKNTQQLIRSNGGPKNEQV